MARRIDFAIVGGMLCAGAALLLLSSGVPAVEAEDTASSSSPVPAAPSAAPMLPPADGPSCRVDAPPDTTGAEALADVNARLATDGQAAANDPDFVVLNNRGYNYGTNSVADPQLLKFEAGSTPP
jgi:hypothetical protein